MKIGFFSTKPYDATFFNRANTDFDYELVFFEVALNRDTVSLCSDVDAVCVFVNDTVDRQVLEALKQQGIHLVALRCAGFNNVDIQAADELHINVVRVPHYSPYAVAEHAVGMMLSLNRKIHRAYARVREGNFSLNKLLGFDMHGKTVGIIGTGAIGKVTANILLGFGCRILASDPQPDNDLIDSGVKYVDASTLFQESRIISLHCPLTPQTHHLINQDSIRQMQDGVMIINTSRGAVIDTRATIDGLKSGKIGYLGLDVYEQEGDLFFHDLSEQVIQDDVFERLLTFPNVLVTGHQGFFTHEALSNIAATTLTNISSCRQGCPTPNLVTSALFRDE